MQDVARLTLEAGGTSSQEDATGVLCANFLAGPPGAVAEGTAAGVTNPHAVEWIIIPAASKEQAAREWGLGEGHRSSRVRWPSSELLRRPNFKLHRVR